MQFIRKVEKQNNKNLNTAGLEYEINSLNNQRTRSPPDVYSKNFRRSPLKGNEQVTSESGFGEMIFLDPSDGNFRRNQNISPANDSRNFSMISPGVGQAMRADYRGGVINMSQKYNYPQFPRTKQATINIETRQGRFERSPNTFKLGESPQETEYNLKNSSKGRFGNLHSPQGNIVVDKSFNLMSNETGNIFLDQPYQQSNFIQQNEAYNSSYGMIQNSYEKRSGYAADQSNSREIQYNMNPRDLQEPMSGIIPKYKSKVNIEGESDSNSEKNENETKIKDLKTQLDSNVHQEFNGQNEDGMEEGYKVIKADKDKMDEVIRNKETTQENFNSEDVKKLLKYFVNTCNPSRGEDGNLISDYQVSIRANRDQFFNDRYKVLQKMHKLSSILLAKNRNASPSPDVYATLNGSSNIGEIDDKKKFNRATLNNTTIIDASRKTRKIKKNKFLYISLAMLSAKGPNTEDRTILRRMRLDKGGVVDLAQENLNKKNKFKIRKVKPGGRGITTINPKYRDKAARILQAWWRERKEKYKKILEKIIKIQSVWRGKFTRKYVYDIIYISYLQEKFVSIMRHVLVNHIRPYVFGELFSKKKLIKEILGELLERKDSRFSSLRLAPYFYKWYAITNLLKKRIKKSKDLIEKKDEEINKKKILKKYLDRWALITDLYKYIGKAKDEEKKRKKFFGTLNIINGLTSLTKNQIYKCTKEPIIKFLRDKLRQKALTKMLKNKEQKMKFMSLRKYFYKWKDIVNKIKIKELKSIVIARTIIHIDTEIKEKKMKYYFNKWKRRVPKVVRLLDINEGGEILRRFTLRTTFIHPLNAFSEKCDIRNTRLALIKLLVIKQRKIRENIKEAVYKWKGKIRMLKDKEKRDEIFATLIKDLVNSYKKRLLYKKFSKWNQRPKIDVNERMRKITEFTRIISEVMKNNLKPDKEKFLVILDKTRDIRALIKACKKLFKNYNNKRIVTLRYYLIKWRSQAKKDEIYYLHKELLRFIITYLENMKNKTRVLKYFTRWRLFTEKGSIYDNMEKLKKVWNGGDILKNIYQRNIRELFYRFNRYLGKDYRPLFIKKIIEKINKPRTTTYECFQKWRRINEKLKAAENIRNLKAKFINLGIKHIIINTERDKLMKSFFKWKTLCLKPDDYYPNIAKGFNIITHYIKKNISKEPFIGISRTKNYTKIMTKIFKNYQNQGKRLYKSKLINLFGRWRKKAIEKKIKELITSIIFKTRFNREKNNSKTALTKYFTKWKLYRKKGLDAGFVKGIDILTNICKKPFRKTIFDIFKTKISIITKREGAENLIKTINGIQKSSLHKTLLRIWKNSVTIDRNRIQKIKTRLRRIIRNREKMPEIRAFYKWIKQVKIMEIRDQEKLRRNIIIINRVRNNDRTNLSNAMRIWQKRVHYLREQYLKSLLVKQIKTSQKIKQDLTDKERLRRALLKWSSKVMPTDYMDRIKKIRTGCKLFKRGLRKIDGRNLFDAVKNLTINNKKKMILKKIISKIQPKLETLQKKKVILIIKEKLADVEKNKLKIQHLFEDYIYSDKVHKDTFTNTKNTLVGILKKHGERKRKAGKKIVQFVTDIKENNKKNNKMKIALLLTRFFKKRQNVEKDLLKIKLIQFHRQVQKVKNNENAKIIQKFIRKKLRNYFDKKKLIEDGLNKFDLLLKMQILKKFNNKVKKIYCLNLLKKIFTKKEKDNFKIIKIVSDHWKSTIPILIKEEAIKKIINNYRIYKSKKILIQLKKRIYNLKKLVEKKSMKNYNILSFRLYQWLYRANKLQRNQNAQIIQVFCRGILKHTKRKTACKMFKNLVNKHIFKQVATIVAKTSRITGGKGDLLFKTLQDILIMNPYKKLINRLFLIRRVNALFKLIPKVDKKNQIKLLIPALKKWRNNTYGQTIKSTKIIQQFLRIKHKKKMENIYKKRNEILIKLIQKKSKNNKYILQLPFTIWSKKAKLMKVNENVIKIQNAFRRFLAGKKYQKIMVQNIYKKLGKQLLIKKIKEIFIKLKVNKELIDKRRNILGIIFKGKIYNDDKSKLKVFISRWKKYINYIHLYATRIQNAFRVYKANKLKNKLKKIKILLTKYVLKHCKTDVDYLRAKLRKWKNIVNKIRLNDNSKIIQHFIRPKLRRLLYDKFVKFFYDNSKKKALKLLNLCSKLNKLQNALNKPIKRKFDNNLKKTIINKKITEKLIILINRKDNNFSDLLKKIYLKRWIEQKNKLIDKINKSVSLIQRVFLSYIERKNVNKKLKIKKILTLCILRKEKIGNNLLYYIFRKWNNIVRILACNDNAKIIQKFCRSILEKIKRKKNLDKQTKIKNGIEKLIFIKIGRKYALDKIRNQSKKNLFIKFITDINNHRLKTLKEIFRKIKQTAFDNKLIKVIGIADKLKLRILVKFFKLYNDKVKKLARKRAIEMIKKNWKLYLKRKKIKNRLEILKNIFRNLVNKKSDIKLHYFKKWHNIAKKITIDIAKRKVANYLFKRYKISNSRKNWLKISRNLLLKNRSKNLYEFVRKIKLYQKLLKFQKPFTNLVRKTFIITIKNNKRNENIEKILRRIIENRNDKNNRFLLKYLIERWKNKKNKLKDRENKLIDSLRIIFLKKIKNGADKTTKAMIIKKFVNIIPLIKAKLFLKKLRDNMNYKNKFNKLKINLIKGNENTYDKTKNIFISKVHKLYGYYKINRLIEICSNNLNKNKKTFTKKLISRLYVISKSKSQYTYKNKQESLNKAKTTKLSFIYKPPKKIREKIEEKLAPIKKCIPSFIDYLAKMIIKRKEESMNKIKDNYKSNKFCALYKIYIKKSIKPYKEELIKRLKREVLFEAERPFYQVKLYKIIRKKYIKEIITTLKEPIRLYRLFYLLNITKMHKTIATQRFFRELIRKWRFITFSKKMARKKLELMYKNLHASYLQMADEIFGDENNINPSVFKEFERFGSDVGMFTGQEPEADEEIGKKFYSSVGKKYIFTSRPSISTERKILSKEYKMEEEEYLQMEKAEFEEEKKKEKKDIKNKVQKDFNDIKQGGFSRKYFKKEGK